MLHEIKQTIFIKTLDETEEQSYSEIVKIITEYKILGVR